MSTAIVGADGSARCPWAVSDPLSLAYHDTEWGLRVDGEAAHLERLTLEAFQSGLSWRTILPKRPAFREVFCDFDPERVAEFTDADVERLMDEPRIVRNRRKIEAAVTNAQRDPRPPRDRRAGGAAVVARSRASTRADDRRRRPDDLPRVRGAVEGAEEGRLSSTSGRRRCMR